MNKKQHKSNRNKANLSPVEGLDTGKITSNERVSPLLGRPIRVNTQQKARQLLSRLILEFQKGTIKNKDAKDLCYLIISYVNVSTQTDIEERVKKLEG